MSLWTVWQLATLSSVLYARPGWTFSCPMVCQCTEESLRCTRETELNSSDESSLTYNLRLTQLPFKEVQTSSFTGLLNVARIEISQSDSIRTLRVQAFFSLPSLSEVLIQNINNLVAIEKGAFTDLPKLKYLSICNTGLRQFPDLTTISSLESHFFLEMGDNIKINTIPSNAFLGMTQEFLHMNLVRNGFEDIQRYAFNGTRMDKLVLKDNKFLHKIHDDAFEGATGPSLLDVSSTALRSLPAHGLQQVNVLMARSTPGLKTLPSLENLLNLQEAHLTYPSHCCAFHTWRRQQRENAFLKSFGNLSRLCNSDQLQEISYPSSNGLPYPDDGDGLYDLDFHYPDLEVCVTNAPIRCTPEPDAFNPCEDLLGYTFLRAVTWIITVFAISGNLAVLGVLVTSRHKLTVSRFLMCNLAFADLCMGVYLLLIASVDYHSRRQYYNHATHWQTGAGCGVAGFLTVFASELSVYTLTVITLERWHTITYAMQLERKLRLRHVAAMMAAGWGFSLLAALLPVLGVSSYTKVSICLPMDIEAPASQGYVVAMLLLNVAAFLVICACYGRIYLTVRNPHLATRHSDAKMAKRMAVLIFTDFLCMAPISFFAISAALRMPLITVSHSKILLILFYPINSLCNPFLYTIFTRAFRLDVCLLLSRCGCCRARAELYRMHSLTARKAPKSAPSRKPSSLRFYAYHIKMQGCFLNKGAK
ncbi:lutropin-choriogonadotropic hormone receptor-like [Megalops cyprinoides]|uniref:lutropin-choriogonadotropic hormone receptor-like n=1 Tax=Megalops cyprinoides TaxID=118141 RepID=UPI00186441E2|nr:lutropin-choriogonadotropic hormone receptor-like [Megalops cyprinoides]